MALLTALALLLAILAFQNEPPVDAPPPIPTQMEGDGSGEPQSGEPESGEPQSGEPESAEPQSGSPSPGSDGGPYDDSPSMEVPDDSEDGPGGPSVNPKL